MFHVVAIFTVAVISFLAGSKYGSRGLTAVKAEILAIESEIKRYGLNPLLLADTNVKNIIARIKAKL